MKVGRINQHLVSLVVCQTESSSCELFWCVLQTLNHPVARPVHPRHNTTRATMHPNPPPNYPYIAGAAGVGGHQAAQDTVAYVMISVHCRTVCRTVCSTGTNVRWQAVAVNSSGVSEKLACVMKLLLLIGGLINPTEGLSSSRGAKGSLWAGTSMLPEVVQSVCWLVTLLRLCAVWVGDKRSELWRRQLPPPF